MSDFLDASHANFTPRRVLRVFLSFRQPRGVLRARRKVGGSVLETIISVSGLPELSPIITRNAQRACAYAPARAFSCCDASCCLREKTRRRNPYSRRAFSDKCGSLILVSPLILQDRLSFSRVPSRRTNRARDTAGSNYIPSR